MRRTVKFASFLMMVVLLSTMAAAAVEKPAAQTAGSTGQLVIGQDVITASDAGGGRISSRDLLIIIAIGVAILVVALVL